MGKETNGIGQPAKKLLFKKQNHCDRKELGGETEEDGLRMT
jgi:hypothetical protein